MLNFDSIIFFFSSEELRFYDLDVPLYLVGKIDENLDGVEGMLNVV